MSCSGDCCTYDSSEEDRHVSLQGRVGGEGSWLSDTVSRTMCFRSAEVGNSSTVQSSRHTHMPRDHGLSPSHIPVTQHCTRRLSTHSNWPTLLVVSTVLLLLSRPALLAASQAVSSPTVMYGLPDVVAAVGQSFSLRIPEDAFSGHIAAFEITALGAHSLPEWLTFDPDERTLSGLPLQGDEKSWLIQVRAYSGEAPDPETLDDEENLAECIFQLEVVSEEAVKSSKHALAMFDKDTFRLPAKKPQSKGTFIPPTHHKTSFCSENAKSTYWAGLVLSANFSTFPVEWRLSVLRDFANFFAVSSDAFSIGKDLSGPVVKASSDVPNARIASTTSMISFPVACDSFDPRAEPYSSLLHRLNVCLLECQSQSNHKGHTLTVGQWIITKEKMETTPLQHEPSRHRRQVVQAPVDEQPSTVIKDIFFVFTTVVTTDGPTLIPSISPVVTSVFTPSSVQPTFTPTSFILPASSSMTIVPSSPTTFLSSPEETPTFSSIFSSVVETETSSFFSSMVGTETSPLFPSQIPSTRVVPTSVMTLAVPSSSEPELSISMPVFTFTPEATSPSVVSASEEPTPVLSSSPSITLTTSSLVPSLAATSALVTVSITSEVVVSSSPSPSEEVTPSFASSSVAVDSSVLLTSIPVVPPESPSLQDSTVPEETPTVESSSVVTVPPTTTTLTPSLMLTAVATSSSLPLPPPPLPTSIESSSIEETPSFTVPPTTTTLTPSLMLTAVATSSSLPLPPPPLPTSIESSSIEETPSFTLLTPSESTPVVSPQPSPSPPASPEVSSSSVETLSPSPSLPASPEPTLTPSSVPPVESSSVSPITSPSISSPPVTPSVDTTTSSVAVPVSPSPSAQVTTPPPVEPTPSFTSIDVTSAETLLSVSQSSPPVISFSSRVAEVSSITPSVTSMVMVSSSPVVLDTPMLSVSSLQTSVTLEVTTFASSSPVLPPDTVQPSSSIQVEPTTLLTISSSPLVSSVVEPPTTTTVVTPSLSSAPPSPTPSSSSASPSPTPSPSPSPTPSPSPSPPPNSPPKLVETVGLLNVQHGQVFMFTISESTFMDEEDGLTSNLTLVLLDGFGQPLANTTWVQLSGMQIEGLPVTSPVNVDTVTDFNFILTAVDSEGDFVVDLLTIRVQPFADTGFNATLTIEGDYTLFRQNLSRQIEIAQLIAEGHNSSLSDIQILSYLEGSIRVTYTSVTISSFNCLLQRQWAESFRTPQGDMYLYSDTFSAIFGSRQHNLIGQPEFQGFCSMVNVTLSPTEEPTDVLIPNEVPGSGIGFILFLAVIIPGVVLALTLLVIGIIAFGLYRIRRKERRTIYSLGEERAFLRRNPVILQGEAQSAGRRKRRNPYLLEDEGAPGSIATEVPHSPPPPEFERPRGPDSLPPAYELPPDSYYDKYEVPYDYVETNMYAR